MDGEADVLEQTVLGPLGGDGVGALLALLQALDRFALARGMRELLTAGLDALGLGAGVECRDRPLELAPLDERLAGAQVGAGGPDGNGAVEPPRVGEPGVGVCEGGVAGPAEGQLAGVGLLGGGFCLFA